jgi:KaiC/GvpD/RAD55 family RecA-like ATPase
MPKVFQRIPSPRKGEVTMIAGQSGAGKSLLALWHAIQWVKFHGQRGIYFSADSAELGQASRAVAMTMMNVSVNEAEQMVMAQDPRAVSVMESLNALSWSFEDDLSYENIEEEMMAFAELWGCPPDFVIVDNLMDIEGQSEDEFGTSQRALKALVQLARRTDSAVIVLAHTSEDVKEEPCPPKKAVRGKANQKPAMILTVADHGDKRPVARVKDRYEEGADKSGRTAIFLRLDSRNLHYSEA